MRLQTQRSRDSEFNTTTVVISHPPEEQAQCHHQQITKLKSDAAEDWAPLSADDVIHLLRYDFSCSFFPL